MDRRERLRSARLYLVCPRRPRAFLDGALRGGVDIVQLRDKTASDAELLAAAGDFRAACDAAGALFVLNDRPDLVEDARADGVHVGQDDAPVAAARAAVGRDRLVGLSTHTPAQVDAASGVDYIACGPLRETPTKAGRPAAPRGLLAHAREHARTPWFAIGGIDAAFLPEVLAGGATRIVVVRAIADAEDPEAAARELRAGLDARTGAGVGTA